MLNIAINTFREVTRNKFLYLIVIFAVLFILFSLSLWALSLGNSEKVIVDFGLAMIEIFWLLGVLFVGSQLLFNEIEWKTIFLILSKPLKRADFILGKFFGFSATILLIVLLQSFVFFWLLLIQWISIDGLIISALVFTFLKLEILLAIVLFFSTFMSTMLTIISSFLIYFISHSMTLILDMVMKTKNIFAIYAAKIFALIFPPLEAMNIKDYIWSFRDFSALYIFSNIWYSLLYIGCIMIFTVCIFNRKKFEG